MDRPIPAFYCCYLLRSTIRHQSLYVGSTPNPPRRLGQHNGVTKGGAVRTARDNLRPWEMTCLVTGFPSKISALQFEWAWQNTHMTRHIAADDRITQAPQKIRYSPRSGKTRKRIGRPRVSLTDKLANLHILLRARSFERWPLEVKFFAEDVFKLWQRCDRTTIENVRPGIRIALHESSRVAKPTPTEQAENTAADLGPKGIYALDVTYEYTKPLLEKGRSLLEITANSCAVCKAPIDLKTTMTLVCSADGCKCTSHLSCLAGYFIGAEKHKDSIVPTSGSCPDCKETLNWSDLVKDLSLRIRGEKEVAELFKTRKPRRKKGDKDSEGAAVEDEASDDDGDGDLDRAVDVGIDALGFRDLESDDDVLSEPDDAWLDIDDLTLDFSIRKVFAKSPKKPKKHVQARREAVIEDSDWDDAEILD